jgi:hypothetical protein
LGLGAGELGFQAVAEGHQSIDFGDDAALFGEGEKGTGRLDALWLAVKQRPHSLQVRPL